MPLTCRRHLLIPAFLIAALPSFANPLAPGWTLDTSESLVRFQSTKNDTKMETSAFASFEGAIAPDGAAELTVLLDSVDTKVDIRNVRMRFLFFETFNTPEAKVLTQITPDMVDQIAATGRTRLSLPFTLRLSGLEREYTAEVIATLLTQDRIAVSSAVGVPIPVTDYGLLPNLGKLEEAAGGVDIVPVAALNFDLVFQRNGTDAAPADGTPERPINAALESTGQMARDECVSRFLALSEANTITFQANSTRINAQSAGIISQIADTVLRCPGLTVEVGSHTDPGGARAYNQQLSQQRADAVVAALVDLGVAGNSLIARGYGEDRPAFPNDTRENRIKNRRIEFSILQ